MPHSNDSASQLRTPATPRTARRTQVLVIGGGPGGSTAAGLLAERGHRVVVLEKARHPRFHIGESLLPANLPLFERLGVAERMRAIGLAKWGAEFVSPWHGRAETFEFADALNKKLPYAYQVRRSEFDEILIRRAGELGATVVEGCRAKEIDLSAPDGLVRVTGLHDDGSRSSWEADFLIDASGRDTLLASQLGVKRRNPKHRSAAIYAHYTGAPRHAGKHAGNISIYWFEHGWFWYIPLADGTTSVGAVVWPYYLNTRKGSIGDFFLATIELCAPLAQRLRGARLATDPQATGNYSYVSGRTHGENYLLIGDAYCFVDPMFSSGVWLAMHGAECAADAIDKRLREPEHAAKAFRRFARDVRRGPIAYSWFIYRVTNPAMRELFIRPRNPLRMKEALLSLLAGDIFERTPHWAPIGAFKLVYYFSTILRARATWRAIRRRRLSVATDRSAVH